MTPRPWEMAKADALEAEREAVSDALVRLEHLKGLFEDSKELRDLSEGTASKFVVHISNLDVQIADLRGEPRKNQAKLAEGKVISLAPGA